MHVIAFGCICLPNRWTSSYLPLPVFASMQLFLILLSALIAASLTDGLFVCLHNSHFLLTWSTHVVLNRMSPHFPPPLPHFFLLFLPRLSPPVLIWKCFGLQQMTVHIEITEESYDQIIIIQHHYQCNRCKLWMQGWIVPITTELCHSGDFMVFCWVWIKANPSIWPNRNKEKFISDPHWVH